jgi:flagellar hook-basal body complex protein FliE
MTELISPIMAGAAGVSPQGRMTPVMTPGFGTAPIQGAPDFSALVSQATGQAVQSLRQGEAVTQAAVMGRTGTQEMVEAVMSMETSLRTTLAIRDKCVEAYQEIMRMPI